MAATVEDSWVEVEASVKAVDVTMLMVLVASVVREDASVVIAAKVVDYAGRQTAALALKAPKAARRRTK